MEVGYLNQDADEELERELTRGGNEMDQGLELDVFEDVEGERQQREWIDE